MTRVWEAKGKTDEWYTPPEVFDALGVRFDLDVASPAEGGAFVPADRVITAQSLQVEWQGFVWMNAPFGGRNGLVPWLDKFFEHGSGIALTPDRASAGWFHDAWKRADAVLFTRKIGFIRPDGSVGANPPTDSALWASGEDAVAALTRAAGLGLGIAGRPLTAVAA